MENGKKIVEEMTKSENEFKISPTKNTDFFPKNRRKLKKNFIPTISLKKYFEQRKDFIFNAKPFNQKDNKDILNKNFSPPNKNNIKLTPIKPNNKVSKETQKDPDSEKDNNKEKNKDIKSTKEIKENKIANILKKISILKKQRYLTNHKIKNQLSLIQYLNKYQKKINLKKCNHIAKTPYETIKLQKRNDNKNERSSLSSNIEGIIPNINLSKLKETNKPFNSFENSLDNDSIILTKKNSISRINFYSYENKIKYLFGKLRKKKPYTIDKYSNKKNSKITYKLDKVFGRNRTRDISQYNKLIYNIGNKSNSSIYSNNKNISFFEDSEKYSIEKDSLSLLYKKIIMNNKIKRKVNFKLFFFKNPLIRNKNKYFFNISRESENKSHSVPNKKVVY